MKSFILRNWLILAAASLLVAIYTWIFDGFVDGKTYMFFLLSLIFGAVYYWQLKKG